MSFKKVPKQITKKWYKKEKKRKKIELNKSTIEERNKLIKRLLFKQYLGLK